MLLDRCKIPDSTPRDGGYYTDWNFSSSFFDNYLKTAKLLSISILNFIRLDLYGIPNYCISPWN
jgi:hypothetical protein|tara:strand:- start:71 stop:262 length:192 start_codon:yes stop_codon:yes gene_type:complete